MNRYELTHRRPMVFQPKLLDKVIYNGLTGVVVDGPIVVNGILFYSLSLSDGYTIGGISQDLFEIVT